MPRKKIQEIETLARARDWRNLPQGVAIGSDTRSSRRLRSRVVFRWVFTLLLSVGIVGVFVYTWREMMSDESAELSPSTHAAAPEFVNPDGVLNEKWMREWTDFDTAAGTPNLSFLQRRLLEYPQIRDARVERVADGKIRVSVRERRPVARLVSDDGNVRLVAEDGVIFPAATFPPGQAMLPKLRDAQILADEKTGFERVAGIAVLAEFLNLARKNYSGLYVDWDEISLRDLPADARGARLPWAFLRVTPKESSQNPALPRIEEIVFSANRFREDLKLFAGAVNDGTVANVLASAGTPRPLGYRISFITNRKNPRREFREMRMVPTYAETR